MKSRYVPYLTATFLCVAALTGCSEKPVEIRRYTEVSTPPPAPATPTMPPGHPPVGEVPATGTPADPTVPVTGTPFPPAVPVTGTPAATPTAGLKWAPPAGWEEQPGSGMRLATFRITRDGKTHECTITPLGREAGAAIPNIERWIGMIGDTKPSEEVLREMVASARKVPLAGGREAAVYDLSSFAREGGDAILAAIADFGPQVIFIRLTAPPSVLKSEMDAFLQLTASVRE